MSENRMTMKVTIIGAGNMGGAMVRGLMRGANSQNWEIAASNPHENKLSLLQTEWPQLHTYTNNWEASLDADVVILAVEPSRISEVIDQIAPEAEQLVVSVAAGVSLDCLEEYLGSERPLFRAIPNTPVSVGEGMTLLSSRRASADDERLVQSVFREMGLAVFLPEEQLEAGMMLTSCGVAYALKYVQASMQGGVELGLPVQVAMRMVAQTLIGTGRLLLDDDTHPSLEIDRVTTPGGITIRGINELESSGFVSAVVRALKVRKRFAGNKD